MYTVPSDGYVYLMGGSSIGSYAQVYIYDSNNNNKFINLYSTTANTNNGSSQIAFVKKGMRIKTMHLDSSYGAVASFIQLTT